MIESFIADCRACAMGCPDPADCIQAIAPLMARFLGHAGRFLKPSHYRSDPAQYTRNAIHISPEHDLSLYTLVWLPGQWTPVHDHASWGVVGVVEGMLPEPPYISMHAQIPPH